MPFITTNNAAELGRRSGEARRNKPVSFLVPAPINGVIIEPHIARTVSELIRIITEQIMSTRALLNNEDYRYCEQCERGGVEPNHRAQLLKALDSLIERKAKLLGIPDPGSLKPAARQARQPLQIAPIGPSSALNTPTGGSSPKSTDGSTPQ